MQRAPWWRRVISAELDKSEIVGKLKEVEINLQKFHPWSPKPNSIASLTLAQARDEMVNLKYAMEQRKLEKEESTFESP
ncbi:MAG: hypothetical protein U0176_23000 [Bacteroidia bacterium]